MHARQQLELCRYSTADVIQNVIRPGLSNFTHLLHIPCVLTQNIAAPECFLFGVASVWKYVLVHIEEDSKHT